MQQEPLFSLIQSLSQHEKRYLKLFLTHQSGGKEGHSLRLYELLLRQQGYDEAALKAHLGEDPLARQWAVYKNLTYHALLRGLQAYRYESTPAGRIRSGLEKVEILLDKGQPAAALKMIHRTRAIAEEYAQHGLLTDLLNWERRILRSMNPLTYIEVLPRIEAYERKLSAILEQEAEAIRLYDRLFAWVQVERRMEKATLAAQMAAVGERLEALNAIAVPVFSTKSMLLNAQALYRQMHGDYAGMMRSYHEAIALWDSHPKIKEAEPERYARLQAAWLNSLLAAGMIGQHLQDIRALRRIPVQGVADRSRLIFQSYNLELLWRMDQGDPEAAIRFLKTFEEKLPELEGHLDILRLSTFCLNAMILFFRARRYEEVLHWAGRMPEADRQERANVFFRSAQVLALVAHCEVVDFAAAEARLVSLQRRLKQQDADWEFGKVVTQWMSRLLPRLGSSHEDETRQGFQQALNEFRQRQDAVPLVWDLLMKWLG